MKENLYMQFETDTALFSTTILNLLKGEIITNSYPFEDHYQYIEAHKEEIIEYLGRIDKTLKTCRHIEGYFLSEQNLTPEILVAQKNLYKNCLKQLPQLNTILMFFFRQYQLYELTALKFRLSDLETSLDEETKRQIKLYIQSSGSTYNPEDKSDRQLIDKLVEKLERDGFVHLFNKQDSSYVFTGKIEIIYEINDYIRQNMPDEEENTESQNQQKELF